MHTKCSIPLACSSRGFMTEHVDLRASVSSLFFNLRVCILLVGVFSTSWNSQQCHVISKPSCRRSKLCCCRAKLDILIKMLMSSQVCQGYGAVQIGIKLPTFRSLLPPSSGSNKSKWKEQAPWNVGI